MRRPFAARLSRLHVLGGDGVFCKVDPPVWFKDNPLFLQQLPLDFLAAERKRRREPPLAVDHAVTRNHKGFGVMVQRIGIRNSNPMRFKKANLSQSCVKMLVNTSVLTALLPFLAKNLLFLNSQTQCAEKFLFSWSCRVKQGLPPCKSRKDG